MNKTAFIFFSFFISVFSLPAQNKLSVSTLFSNGMVLQQQTEANIWGWHEPGSVIYIQPAWGKAHKVKTDESGRWDSKIKTNKAGGPYSLTITDKKSTIAIEDILIGEVWVCSGQSNMDMPLKGWGANNIIQNSEQEIKEANYPNIRMFNVGKAFTFDKVENVKGSWKACTPENAKHFSAAGYYFARKVHKKINVPIGIIHTSYGSSSAEAWTSETTLKKVPGYEDMDKKLSEVKSNLSKFQNWLNSLPTVKGRRRDINSYRNLNLNDAIFTDIDFNDSQWKSIVINQDWKETELDDFDGVIWYRKSFELSEENISSQLTLEYPKTKDYEQVFLNGVEIGSTFGSNAVNGYRKYDIPKDLIISGKNIIAIKTINFWGDAGFKKTPDIFNNGKATNSFQGDWKYLPVVEIFEKKAVTLLKKGKGYYSKPFLHFGLNQRAPTALYTAMLQPIIPYTIKGVTWYQGESNTDRPIQYRTLFPEMIKNWRSEWGQGDFPFYFVQICPFKNYDNDRGKQTQELREAQFLTMSLPNTGIISTTDIGGKWKIHPENKKDVGIRMALWALAKDYGFSDLAYSGPLYKSSEFKDNKAFLSFTNVHSGLELRGDGGAFEIAGEDGNFHPAKATIEGERIVLTSKKINKPVKARYGWSNWVDATLFNKDGLSAPTFRTHIPEEK